jgi:hypothetical protein
MKKNTQKWNEWFAGITDGDGCFYINKKKEISYEVTTHTTDIRILVDIKNTLKGGAIRPRSGSKSVRFRVKAKLILQDIVVRLNGQLHNKYRLAQFQKVCEILGVAFISPSCTFSLAPLFKIKAINTKGVASPNISCYASETTAGASSSVLPLLPLVISPSVISPSVISPSVRLVRLVRLVKKQITPISQDSNTFGFASVQSNAGSKRSNTFGSITENEIGEEQHEIERQEIERQEIGKEVATISQQSAYLAGIFDSDGTITITISKTSAENSQVSGAAGKALRLAHSRGFNQLSATVTSIDKNVITLLKDSYNFGSVYEEKINLRRNKSPNAKYHWTICSYEDFVKLYELLKKFPLRGIKMHRIRLAFIYFKYKDLKYHLQPPGTELFKIWEKFCNSWFRYSIESIPCR